ncbi:hypothetical protein [Aquimarina sp. SS2-1]|uniref:hypothetical protein n=1 Tax=Aquimarina besae TaxID=3342247 RepID=UPI00366ABBBD
MNTFEDYKKGILEYSMSIKNDSNHQLNRFLSKITPGKIKSASKIIFETENNKQDVHTLSSYFRVSKDKEFLKYLDTVDADKLIPVKQFLNRKTKEPREEVVEYTAWLLDFKPRPFAKFQKIPKELVSDRLDEKSNLEQTILDKTKPSQKSVQGKSNKDFPWKKITITISFVSVILAIVYFGKALQQKDCMVWKNYNYERVACNSKGVSLKYDQDWVDNFKKVKNNDTIQTFFGEGGEKDPKYWYYRKNNKVELFTQSGIHPTENIELKPITQLIVRKYILKE